MRALPTSADAKSVEQSICAGGVVEVPPSLSAWLSDTKKNYIAGEWRGSDKTFPTINPATEEKLSDIAEASRTDVEDAVRAGRETFVSGSWSSLSFGERAKGILRLADLVETHRPILALLETLDTGKPLQESYEGDVARASSNFRFFAEFANEGKKEFKNPDAIHKAFREPLGVVVLITPWNLPLYLETWKLAPALMMGNSCILKPSELTPLTATYLMHLVLESGLPKNVVQLVHGFGEKSAGEYLCSHPGIDAISFTGETGTGRAIMRTASVGPTRVSFELGGKGALVVCEDADVSAATDAALRAAFRNQGQICLACPRVYVHRSHYDHFVDSFTEKANALRVGNPLDMRTQMGSLIGREHFEKVSGYLSAMKPPASFRTGGPAPKKKGYFVSPTVVTGVSAEDRITREEIFGPVVSIYPFQSDEEAASAVNSTQYGLSASVFTKSARRADYYTKAIHAGLVWINCWFVRDLRVPFGGQKKSGVGREGGEHALDFFSEWKSTCTRVDSLCE